MKRALKTVSCLSWNWRFQKELKAEWEAFRKECAEKKFPDKSSYPDFFAFQNKFQWWNNEFRNKKWDGKPEEALKAAQAREAARKGMVLLKNNDAALPLNNKQKAAIFTI